MPPGVPRIGRRDLYPQQPRRGVPSGFRPDPIKRALGPDPIKRALGPDPIKRALEPGALADQLGRLPAALGEIAKRVRVHCGREIDGTLAQQLEQLSEHAWRLWLAMAPAARGGRS